MKRIFRIESKIKKIKKELQKIGEMRPGILTKQYRVPKKKIGPYYQLSYTHKMKSRTEYVRPFAVATAKKQISQYKKFRKLVTQWIDLSITRARLKVESMKKTRGKSKST